MKILETQSFERPTTLPKRFALAFLVLSSIGFLDSAYLAVKHYTGGTLKCFVVSGCDKVTSSSYALIGGVPVALVGVIFYLAVLGLTIAYFDAKNKYFLVLASFLTFAGFLGTLRFLYLQAFIIKSYCSYCIVSAAVSSILFSLGLVFVLSSKRIK